MRFNQSARGLSPGATVDFRGVAFGNVKSIQLDFDPRANDFYTEVLADVYPERLGPALHRLRDVEKNEGLSAGQMWGRLVERGLRGQLRSGNLLTGQLYIALDFTKKPKPVPFDPAGDPIDIPTEPGGIDQLQEQLKDIVDKIDTIPFGEIGNNLRDTLKNASSLLKQLDSQIAPEARKTIQDAEKAMQSLQQNLASPDAPLQQDTRNTMLELKRTARSLRNLSDYLEQHPESLIRGKSPDPEPTSGPEKNDKNVDKDTVDDPDDRKN